MYCTHCGQIIDDQAAVCPHCGVAVGTQRRFCAHCGAPVTPEQAVCLKCGCATATSRSPFANLPQGLVVYRGQSVNVAVLLSCLLPGVGQIYLGQTMKGLALLVLALVLGSATLGTLGVVVWLVALIDAHKIGTKLAAGQPVREWDFF